MKLYSLLLGTILPQRKPQHKVNQLFRILLPSGLKQLTLPQNVNTVFNIIKTISENKFLMDIVEGFRFYSLTEGFVSFSFP